MSWNEPPSPNLPDPWADPASEHQGTRRRLLRHRLGFSAMGLGLLVVGLVTIGQLILLFSGRGLRLGAILGVVNWDLIVDSFVVWSTALGAVLIWGHWPDENWRRRSGLLLMMCLVDVVLWSLDNAAALGLAEGKVGHEWFRHALGQTLCWSEFALVASLAADLSAHLGEPQAIDVGKAARSLSTTGAMVWFLYFYFRTDWRGPIWPLRELPFNPMSVILALGFTVLVAINVVQVSALSLLAARCCGRALRQMAEEDRKRDLMPSRSEAGWDDLNPGRAGSGPKPGR